MNNSKKEIRIFCDVDTNIASVRIFKYRNYTWSGGKTYDLKRDCDRLKELSDIIMKYRDEKTENKVWSNREIFWQGKSEIAIGYNVDMSGITGVYSMNSDYYLGKDLKSNEG
jgi:hypothetical protein